MFLMIRKVRKTAQPFAALALIGALAAGCAHPLANQPQHAVPADQRFPISVEPQMTTIGVRIDPGLQRLDPAEIDRVEAFAENWKTRGQGAVTVSAPQGSPNQRAGEAAMAQTVSILRKNGVPDHMIARTGYPAAAAPGEPPVTLSFLSLTAVSPDCSKVGFPDNLGFSPRNTPWTSFGCATQNNIAAMISNPRDLLEPKPMGDADATRRLKVMEDYRKGKATQTNRKADESGKVSTAAQGGGGGE
jgi:pilus assembly protein CpaD